MNEQQREWLRRDERVLWHGVTQIMTLCDTEPILVDRGSGRDLIDVDGRHYLGDWLAQTCAIVAARHEELAAVIIEPSVQAASGMLVSNPEDVKAFGKCCQEYGGLLIADEVATGFGRTGELFASQLTGIQPDLS